MANRERTKRILIGLGIVAAILFLVWLVARVLSEPVDEHVFFDSLPSDRPAVIAHRGGAHLWPENTLEAFRAARSLGVDAIEFDVFATSDGEPILLHDETVDRTTDGSGAVAELSLDGLRELDAGYRFSPLESDAEYPYRGMGVRIPTLREVFEEFPDMPMIVEIKAEDDALVERVVDLIIEFDRVDLTLGASFSAEVVERYRELLPGLATAGVQGEIVPFIVYNFLFVPGVYSPVSEAFMVPTHVGPLPITSRRFIANAQRRGVHVSAWTINDRETMERLQSRGIEGIVTDRPDLALEVVGQM